MKRSTSSTSSGTTCTSPSAGSRRRWPTTRTPTFTRTTETLVLVVDELARAIRRRVRRAALSRLEVHAAGAIGANLRDAVLAVVFGPLRALHAGPRRGSHAAHAIPLET